jgi:hypothetical protein
MRRLAMIGEYIMTRCAMYVFPILYMIAVIISVLLAARAYNSWKSEQKSPTDIDTHTLPLGVSNKDLLREDNPMIQIIHNTASGKHTESERSIIQMSMGTLLMFMVIYARFVKEKVLHKKLSNNKKHVEYLILYSFATCLLVQNAYFFFLLIEIVSPIDMFETVIFSINYIGCIIVSLLIYSKLNWVFTIIDSSPVSLAKPGKSTDIDIEK